MRHPSVSSSRVPIVDTLVVAIVTLGVIATLAGLFWPGGDGAYTITTYRNQEVVIFGRGVYRDSSVFNGAGARGTDVVTLAIVIPMLVTGLVMHRRKSVRGTLLMAGGLVWMLYAYASMSFGAIAYSDLFLLHVAILAASLWCFLVLVTGVDVRTFTRNLHPPMPRKGPGVFLIVSGAVTALIWLIEPVAGIASGEYPELLGVSTTLFTHAFDMAVIAPAAIVAGLLVLRDRPLGYWLAVPLMVLEALLAPMIVAQTFFQVSAGVDFNPVQVTFMIGGFMILAVIAIRMVSRIVRCLDDPVGWRLAGYPHEGRLAR